MSRSTSRSRGSTPSLERKLAAAASGHIRNSMTSKGAVVPRTIDPFEGFKEDRSTKQFNAIAESPPDYQEDRLQRFLEKLIPLTALSESTSTYAVTKEVGLPRKPSVSKSLSPREQRLSLSLRSKLSREVPNFTTSFNSQHHHWIQGQLEDIVEPIPGTCQWIYDKPEYVGWQSSPSGLLVLTGESFTGKTVLMKSICKKLYKDGVEIVPFFCKANDPKRSSIKNILATWTYHLLSNFKQLDKYVGDELRDESRELFLDDIWSLFESFMDDPETSCVFVIDSLDQCDSDSQYQLGNLVLGTGLSMQHKVLLSSVSFKLPKATDQDVFHIELNAERLSRDVRLVIDHEINQPAFSQVFHAREMDYIYKKLEEVAQGSFSYVITKLEELKDTIEEGLSIDLAEFFERAPKSLEGHYASQLLPKLQGEDEHLKEVALILSILLAANHNTLSEFALDAAFSISEGSRSGQLSRAKWRFSGLIKASILRTCGSLLRSKRDDLGKVSYTLAHPIVKSFLTGKATYSSDESLTHFLSRINLEAGHSLLSQACLKHITTSDRQDSNLSVKRFYDYSLENWPVHLRGSGARFKEYEDLLSGFLNPYTRGYKIWCDLCRISKNKFGTTPNWWDRPIPVSVTLVHERLNDVIDGLPSPRANDKLFLGTTHIDLEDVDDFGRTPLMIALEMKNFKAAWTLLFKGASPHGSTSTKFAFQQLPPLHLAVRAGNEKLVSHLLREGAKIDFEATYDPKFPPQSCLFWGATASMEIWHELLKFEPRVFVRGSDGWSILHETVLHCEIDKIKDILSRGLVSVNHTATDGYTPLMIASGPGKSSEAVRTLLHHGANPHLVARDGSTALFEAVTHGQLESVAILLNQNVKTTVCKNGEPLIVRAVYQGHTEITRRLLARSTDVINAKTTNNDTALMVAARQSKGGFVQLLLRNGADPDAVNEAGQTALYIAASGKRPDDVQSLLKYSSDREAASKFAKGSWSCLHEAAFYGRLEIVKQLVGARDASDDINELSLAQEWTPLMAALAGLNDEIARYLWECGARIDVKTRNDWTTLHMACFYSRDEALVEGILRKLDEISRDKHRTFLAQMTEKGSTPLSVAAEKGFDKAVKLLLARSKEEVLVCNDFGNTPLYYAANFGSAEAVKELVKVGVSAVNIPNHFGWKVLHAACQKCDYQTVAELIQLTKSGNSNKRNLTPLHIAIDSGNDEAFEAILQANWSPSITSSWGSSPLLQASVSGNSRYVSRLLQSGAGKDVDSFNWRNYLPLNGAYISRNTAIAQAVRPSTQTAMRLSLNNLGSLMHGAASMSLAEVMWAVDRGLQTNVLNANHETPLSIACENGLADVVHYLLELEKERQRDHRVIVTGWSALHMAARSRHAECIAALAQDDRFDPYAQDCFGLTAFDYAYGDVPSWLALTNSHDVPQKFLKNHEGNSGEHSGFDIRQVPVIASWRLRQLRDIHNQFDEADAHLAAYAMVDPLLRLKDYSNAAVAIDICLGEPSVRVNISIYCQICRKIGLDSVFVCKSCPFRLLCYECKEVTRNTQLRGCLQHSFLKAPSKSWFHRDMELVNENQTEEQWLESLRDHYLPKVSEVLDGADKLDITFSPPCSSNVIFNRCKGQNLTLLLDHLKEHPRDIAVRDHEGRSVVMHVLGLENSTDNDCLIHLQLLATQGAKMLTFDNHKISTIRLACERKFEKCLNFLLHQWDCDFDDADDPFSSSAISTMIANRWETALTLSIERHLNWMAREKYRFLPEVLDMDVSIKRLVDEMIADNAIPTPSSSNQGNENLLAYLESALVGLEPQVEGHLEGCFHTKLTEQITTMKNKGGLVGSENTGPFRSTIERTSPPPTQLEIPNTGPDALSRKKEFLELLLSQSDTSSEFDEKSIDDQQLDQGIDVLEITRRAISFCGIAGLYADGDSVFRFPTSGQPLEIMYSQPTSEPQKDPREAVEQILRAGKGFLQGVATAQEAKLCCSTFSVLHKTDGIEGEGKSVVKLSRVSLAQAKSFVDAIEKFAEKLGIPDEDEHLQRCSVMAKLLLEPYLTRTLEYSSFGGVHVCALAVQFLSLGFVMFLMGHRANAKIPIFNAHITRFDLKGVGLEENSDIQLSPTKMACIGDMLEDEVFVFSAGQNSTKMLGHADSPAMLLATAEDVLEIWTPSICYGEQTDDEEPTGRLLYVLLHGGQLYLTGETTNGIKVAHWGKHGGNLNQPRSFSRSEEILIGSLEEHQECKFTYQSAWNRAFESNMLVHLLPERRYWEVQERAIAAAIAPPYANVQGQIGWGLNRGLPMRQLVLTTWKEGFGALGMLNKPFGIVVSACTGFAERVPLRIAVGQMLPYFLANFIAPSNALNISQDDMLVQGSRMRRKLLGHGCNSTYEANRRFTQYLSETQRELHWPFIQSTILAILTYLVRTGYDEHHKVFRIAWASAESYEYGLELDCQGNFKWLQSLRDRYDWTTFAVMIEQCLVAHRHSNRPYGTEKSCRWRMDQQQSPFNGMHLLYTNINLSLDTILNYQDSTSQRQCLFKYGDNDGRTFTCSIRYLVPRRGRYIEFLVIYDVNDFLGRVIRGLRTTSASILERNTELTAESILNPIRVIRWLHWEQVNPYWSD